MAAHERCFVVGKRIPLETIDAAVSARLGPARVSGNAQPAAFNRQVAMYLAKHVGGWSSTRIGKFYNGRDHSTVCHSIKRVETTRDENAELDRLLTDMSSELRSMDSPSTDGVDCGAHLSPQDWRLDATFIDSLVDRIVDRLVKHPCVEIRTGTSG
jgi:hypothetical protein